MESNIQSLQWMRLSCLELSGIGQRERLESLGIPVVIDNPNVGENLQDHVSSYISYELADGNSSGDVLVNPMVI